MEHEILKKKKKKKTEVAAEGGKKMPSSAFGCKQGRSQPHCPGWARVPLSSSFPQILINFVLVFLKPDLFSSSFWPSGWASRPPGKALATPLAANKTLMRHSFGKGVTKIHILRHTPTHGRLWVFWWMELVIIVQ